MDSHLQRLMAFAAQIRRDAVAAIFHAGSGHPGGSLSCADILAVLYGEVLALRPAQPDWPERDRFVLSKGHACPALYAAGAGAGLLPREALPTLRRLGSPLQGHPHVIDLPWVETSTGSLGQGFSFALGLALGLRHRGVPAWTCALLGDGELQEGMVWETAMAAAHHRMGNFTAIVDYNRMQSDNLNERIMGLEPLADKWTAFGWEVREVDGHDLGALRSLLADLRNRREDRPALVLAHTRKGRGVSFMEGSPLWHGSVKLRPEECERALRDLGASETDLAAYLAGRFPGEVYRDR